MTTTEAAETAIIPPGERVTDLRLWQEARAQRDAWAPSTFRTYRAAWKTFTGWCEREGLSARPADPVHVAEFLEHLVEAKGRTLATARTYLAAIAASHRLGGHPDPTLQTIVRATLKRLGREHGRLQRQAKPLTAEALAAVRATAALRRGRKRRESQEAAERRALMDMAILQVMRDGLLRRSEAAVLTWGHLELRRDGSGRVHVASSKTDQDSRGVVLYLGPDAVAALLAIRPAEAVMNPTQRVFGLSASQIGRRVRAAARAAGLGDGFSGHSMRVGMAQDLSAAGAELRALMEAGRWSTSAMPARYTEAQAAARGAVARYYRGRRGHENGKVSHDS